MVTNIDANHHFYKIAVVAAAHYGLQLTAESETSDTFRVWRPPDANNGDKSLRVILEVHNGGLELYFGYLWRPTVILIENEDGHVDTICAGRITQDFAAGVVMILNEVAYQSSLSTQQIQMLGDRVRETSAELVSVKSQMQTLSLEKHELQRQLTKLQQDYDKLQYETDRANRERNRIRV